MNNKPFVSIIIPFYNTPENIFGRCVKSLISQTYADFEAIVVNDGSEKECEVYLKKVVGADDRFRVINKSNEGSAVARNVGIKNANGDYIMFVDSDDTLTPYCLEEAAEIVENSNPDLVLGGVRKVSEDEIDSVKHERNTKTKYIKVESEEKKNSLMVHMIGCTDVAFLLQECYIADGPVARMLRRSIAGEVLFPDENIWNEDTIWNTKMLKKCKNIIIIDDVWYNYLIYFKSQTRGYRPNCQHEFEYITKQEIDLFKELWPNCMKGVYIRVIYDIALLCRTFLFHPDNHKSWRENYQVYKSCIHTVAYREALQGMDLKWEKRIVNRVAKHVFRLTAYYGPHIISYCILWIYYSLIKKKI